ncbi:MAG: DUF5103 domain-containing protein [Bacteroidales bacterium]|nr:DUF5103 domain-containing protein [Bacteroidales bacterium]
MKRLAILFLLAVNVTVGVWAQAVTDSAWHPAVRTVSLCRDGIEFEPPVLTLGTGERLVLRFDVLQAAPMELRYSIAHCNRDFEPDGMPEGEFMNGFAEGAIDNMQFSFTTNTDYVNYWQTVPADYSEFVASGNYVITIYQYDHPDSVLLTRRFYVSEAAAKVTLAVDRATSAEGSLQNQEVSVGVEPMQNVSQQYLCVRLQQNGRVDNLRTLEFSGYDRNAYSYSRRSVNVFPGGNAFRYFDISNIRSPMHNVQQIERYGGETFAILRPLENRSTRPLSSDRTLQGGMKVNVWDRDNKLTEADYVWVNFSLPAPTPLLGGSVHIVGDITDWAVDDRSRMEWNPRYKAYNARLFLKQGYYSYQVLYKPVGEREAQTALFEGDHYAATNAYTAYVYMRTPSDRYDRLLAVGRTFTSK